MITMHHLKLRTPKHRQGNDSTTFGGRFRSRKLCPKQFIRGEKINSDITEIVRAIINLNYRKINFYW